jgi:hypothetical protein
MSTKQLLTISMVNAVDLEPVGGNDLVFIARYRRSGHHIPSSGTSPNPGVRNASKNALDLMYSVRIRKRNCKGKQANRSNPAM